MTSRRRTELDARRELKQDLLTFARVVLRIRAKDGEIIPLRLNAAQLYLHKRLEEQRKTKGYVRALCLKARQEGCSTYVQARFYHRIVHQRGLRAFILTHEDEATKNLFEIARRFLTHSPSGLTPSVQASNARELLFDKLDSGYRVATAGTKEAGRSATLQLFHGSECGHWPHAETHLAGALQAVPSGDAARGTEIILESTSAGPRGMFYEKWVDAEKGIGDFVPIFIPWFWMREYRSPMSLGAVSAEERDYAQRYKLDQTQMAWRRAKIQELGGVWHFRREYPATPQEAFAAESPGALWTRKMIGDHRIAYTDLPQMRRMAVALDPATTSKETSDEWGIVWGGQGVNGQGYVMGDESMRGSPKACATVAVELYRQHRMEALIYESNQGGDMVPTIIHEIDPTVRCLGVHASRGKRARAEPVAMLYEQGRVHHVGDIPALEDQMTTWNAARSNESPNRIDACVWLLSELLLGSIPTVAIGGGEAMTGRKY